MKMIDEALKYAKAGIPVFPLHWLKADGNCSCRQGALCQAKGKHPRIKNWGDEATMIYLLRHGADDDMRLGGWSDAELSFVGIEQIRRASEKLSSGDYNIQHIFSSDLPRAKESAVIIAEKLGLHVTFIKDFRETNNG
ncbi:MAG: histidine phosphatase family protein, partial [Clostridia bacterium]|nr:histidine phosphatase family protein [Clostridia bacterium]